MQTSPIIDFFLGQGVPFATVILILMLPIIATFIAFLRQVVGIKAFGIYAPLIVTFAFLATNGLKYGIAIFVTVIFSGMLMRFVLKPFRLLYLPRVAIMLTAVAMLILGILVIGGEFKRTGLAAVSIFPILIMITIVEKFVAVQIEKGDWVILSSKFIPGNEKAISRLINNLYRRKAEVFYEKVAKVHISGHACAQELRQMIEVVRPRFFIPVHGEYRHLVRHGRLAESLKIPHSHIFVCENGDQILFSNGKAQRLEPLEFQPLLIQSDGKGPIETGILKERRQLSQTGLVCVIVVRSLTKKGVEGLYITHQGVLAEGESKSMIKRLKDHLLRFLKETKRSDYDLQEELRLYTRRFFKNELGFKPIVLPIFLDK